MEENEETVTTARRTRSKRVVKTPIVKSPKAKPATRRTRKKVVLMEVEVSDEEEETTHDLDASEEEKQQENAEKEITDNTDKKEKDIELKIESTEKKLEVNGSDNNSDEAVPDSTEDSITVVFNDVDMLEGAEDSNLLEQDDTDCSIIEPQESSDKVQVESISSVELEEKNKSTEVEATEEKAEVVKNNETLKVVEISEVTEANDEIVKETVENPVIVAKLETSVTKMEVDEDEEFGPTAESDIASQKLAQELIDNKTEKPAIKVIEEKLVPENKESPVDETPVAKVEKEPVAKVEEDPVAKVEEEPVAKVEEEPVAKVEEEPVAKVETKLETKVEGKLDEEKAIHEKEKKLISDQENPETEAKPKVEAKEKEKKDIADEDTEMKDKLADTDAENISEDELPVVQAVKVPEAEEVSDEELPGPKRAELPADTEVVSEDELPTVKTETKKEGTKRKLDATDYDPGSPTSENEAPTKKPSLEAAAEKEKDEKPKPKKLPELDKYWKAVNDDPTDFTGWTYLLQYVDQENDMEAAREAYDAFLSHYPYCYGYWRKYADYEKRKGNKKKCEEVFERGLKAIPLSVDLWIHYLTYVKTTRTEDEDFIRSQFERALTACGLEFRSDRLWESYIKWEMEGKRLRRVTAIYDRLLATPTQSYTGHFDSFQEHIANNPPNKVIEVDEFLALRKEVRHMLKHDVTTTDTAADNSDAPPGDDDQTKVVSSDEETKSIRERIVSIRRKAHKATVNAVTARWNYEEGIKRPYFHVKPLERCQLKNWQDYLDYETEQGDRVRIIVLFERCLIACALYEEFWLKFVHYLESLKDAEFHAKIRDVYERACTIHHLKKPSLHLQWAMFEEGVENFSRAAEILVNLEKSVPNILQIAYRRINLERRRSDHDKCMQLYEHYINTSKNKMISSNIAIKYSRFCFKILKDFDKAQEVLKAAIAKDPNNPRLYLQLVDLALQKADVADAEIIEIIDSFLDKESTDVDQKVLFSQRKLEYVEDFGADVQSVQAAYEQYQKWLKQSKDSSKKKEAKVEPASSSKKEKSATPSSSTANAYSNYGTYGNSSAQPSYPYSGSQQGQNYYPQYGQGDQQYQYQNWQYPQGGYGGYNQWGGYSGGYGY